MWAWAWARARMRVNFDKSTTKLHHLCTFSILKKFLNDQKLIVMSLANCLNSNFCSLN